METKARRIFGGLHPLPQDERDFSHAAVFGALPVEELPTVDFDVVTPHVFFDQQDLDFCSGFSTAGVNGDQEGLIFDPYWQFAKIKQVRGEWHTWGADMRQACQALCDFGSLPSGLAPFSYPDKTRDFLANWQNYPAELEAKAALYKKDSFFNIKKGSGLDTFDSVRAALWKHRSERCTALVGSIWHDEWTYAEGGVIPPQAGPGGEGHMFEVFGQVTLPGESEPRLKAKLTSGQGIGDKGVFYFPREVVNHEFGPFGQMMLVDMSPEKAKYMLDRGITTEDSFFARWKKIINFSLLPCLKS